MSAAAKYMNARYTSRFRRRHGTALRIDDVKKKIDAIEWLSDADRQQIYEGTATQVYKLTF